MYAKALIHGLHGTALMARPRYTMHVSAAHWRVLKVHTRGTSFKQPKWLQSPAFPVQIAQACTLKPFTCSFCQHGVPLLALPLLGMASMASHILVRIHTNIYLLWCTRLIDAVILRLQDGFHCFTFNSQVIYTEPAMSSFTASLVRLYLSLRACVRAAN